MRLLIEGWRSLPHSYSIVNQFQCLELLKRPGLEIFHRDMPHSAHWRPTTGLFDPQAKAAIAAIPAPDDRPMDAVLRIAYPFNFKSTQGQRTGVFLTSELGYFRPEDLDLGGATLPEALTDPSLVLITPSHWSKQGLVRCGIVADRIAIVPHGFDPQIFHPVDEAERSRLRQNLGWDEFFVFLHIGAMSSNKAVDLLLKAFAAVVDRHPHARLFLKGLDDLYASQQELMEAIEILSPTEATRTLERVIYLGDSLSFAGMAQLYQAADAYVSPYVAEGFNLPVLEAIACGLPTICTQGGPTDDFTRPDFALRINSNPQTFQTEFGPAIGLAPDYSHLVGLMRAAIEQPAIVRQAGQVGSQYVTEHFTWKHSVDALLTVLGLAEGLPRVRL